MSVQHVIPQALIQKLKGNKDVIPMEEKVIPLNNIAASGYQSPVLSGEQYQGGSY